MITKEPTREVLEEWKSIWLMYKEKLRPNRKTGMELLQYLQDKYVLTEIHEARAFDAIIGNVTMNSYYAEKLPKGTDPIPKAFFLENIENGKIFYCDGNRDGTDIWGGEISRIFVGIDLVTGFFMAEGSTMLWDELYAFRGLDEQDLKNYVCVAEYINCLKRFDLLQATIPI